MTDEEDAPEEIARMSAALRDDTSRVGLEPLVLPLPEFHAESPVRVVASHTDPGIEYSVNLNTVTCTCPDFTVSRVQFEVRDLRRACKHLLAEIGRDGLFDALDDVTRAVVEAGYPKRDFYRALVASNPDVVIGMSPGHLWIDVYARTERRDGATPQAPYHRYGWKVSEQTWSYGEAPVGASEIRHLLKTSGLERLALTTRGWHAQERAGAVVAGRDPLFDDAQALVRAAGSATPVLLQRGLRIGYGRAAQLIDQLHLAGIIGPANNWAVRPLLVDQSRGSIADRSVPNGSALHNSDQEADGRMVLAAIAIIVVVILVVVVFAVGVKM